MLELVDTRTEWVVGKFGGTSLADPELFKIVAGFLKECLEKNPRQKVAAVVSAMGKYTDEISEKAKAVAPNLFTDNNSQIARELDNIMYPGEAISAGLLAMALKEIGVKAKSLNARQLGIETEGGYQNARLKQISLTTLENEAKNHDVLVIAGFQGIHENEPDEIVTLGRGGSDLTAIALAALLKCKCIFFKNAAGITAFDPQISNKAKVYKQITHQNALDTARYGYHFLLPRALVVALNHAVPLEFRASPGLGGDPWQTGTVICANPDCIENTEHFCSIAVQKDIILVAIENVPNEAGWTEKILGLFSEKKVNVIDYQTIICGANQDKAVFTVFLNNACFKQIERELEELKASEPKLTIVTKSNLHNLTVIDSTMVNTPGFGWKIGQTLAQENISIQGQASSGNMIHSFVRKEDTNNAVLALAQKFNLLS